jgi:hypothetical protein
MQLPDRTSAVLSFRDFTIRRCFDTNSRFNPMSREMALVAYRNLLRSARIAFQGTSPVLPSLILFDLHQARRCECSLCRAHRGPQELREQPAPADRHRGVPKVPNPRQRSGKVSARECCPGTSHRGRQLQYGPTWCIGTGVYANWHRNPDTRAHRARRQRGHQEEQGQDYIRRNEVLLRVNFCSVRNVIPMSSIRRSNAMYNTPNYLPNWDSWPPRRLMAEVREQGCPGRSAWVLQLRPALLLVALDQLLVSPPSHTAS